MTLYKKYRELIIYFIFGCLTTLVNWVVYGVFVKFCPDYISNVIAWVVAVAFAYVTNKIWVFNSRSWEPRFVLRESGAFVSSRIVSGMFEWFGLPFLVYGLKFNYPLFGIKSFAAKIVVSAFVMVLNYILSKIIVFRKE